MNHDCIGSLGSIPNEPKTIANKSLKINGLMVSTVFMIIMVSPGFNLNRMKWFTVYGLQFMMLMV